MSALTRMLWLTLGMAVTFTMPACGGSSTSTSSPSPSKASPAASSPGPTAGASVNPDQAYRNVATAVNDKIRDPRFFRSCQPIDPTQPQRCRTIEVDDEAKDAEALTMLAGATVPPKFQTLHTTLHDALVRDVTLLQQAVSAIDAGNPTTMQQALDETLKSYNNIAQIISQIQLAQ